MKLIKLTLMLSLLIAAFVACNNKQTKNTNNNNTPSKSEFSRDSITNEKDSALQNQLKICENLVTEILVTSPRYKKLTQGLLEKVIKNGGITYGLNVCVKHDSLGNSKIYNFTLYETYQERQLNSARFMFDPIKKQLYEYDMFEETMKPIEFDKGLLLQVNACSK